MQGLIANMGKGFLFSPPPPLTQTVSPVEMQKPRSLLFSIYHCVPSPRRKWLGCEGDHSQRL